ALDAAIGADQHLLDLIEHRLVEPALGDEIGHGAADRRRGALETAAEPLPPALLLCRLIVHILPVRSRARGDSGFAESWEVTMTPEEIVARLIYRDGLMLVIDKPA